MLSKKERLSREAFNRFFSVGKKKHTPLLTLVYSPSPQFHASVVVSKKVAKSAVKRNKLRRRIYDIVRNHIRKKVGSGVYILITKPEIQKITYKELQKTIIDLIHNLP